MISANQWGIHLDGAGTSGNAIEGNYIGTDASGGVRLGNEIDGVLITNSASQNTIGGTAAGLGNIIAFQVMSGVLIESGNQDSILSNSIFGNGMLGITLDPPGNDLLPFPVLTSVTSNGSVTHIVGSLSGVADNTTFLIQFFTNPAFDPSGYGQGETAFGSTEVTSNGSGVATIDLTLAATYPPGTILSATATEETPPAAQGGTTGDTSEFSQDIAESSAFQFTQAIYVTSESIPNAVITVSRTLTTNAASVKYATVLGGTATPAPDPNADYVPIPPTILNFPAGVSTETFVVQILRPPGPAGGYNTVFLQLSSPNPNPGPPSNVLDFPLTGAAVLQINDDNSGSSQKFIVTNTGDNGGVNPPVGAGTGTAPGHRRRRCVVDS